MSAPRYPVPGYPIPGSDGLQTRGIAVPRPSPAQAMRHDRRYREAEAELQDLARQRRRLLDGRLPQHLTDAEREQLDALNRAYEDQARRVDTIWSARQRTRRLDRR